MCGLRCPYRAAAFKVLSARSLDPHQKIRNRVLSCAHAALWASMDAPAAAMKVRRETFPTIVVVSCWSGRVFYVAESDDRAVSLDAGGEHLVHRLRPPVVLGEDLHLRIAGIADRFDLLTNAA